MLMADGHRHGDVDIDMEMEREGRPRKGGRDGHGDEEGGTATEGTDMEMEKEGRPRKLRKRKMV